MSGRHARSGAPRRSTLLLTVATVLGIWFGASAPDISPVTPPPAPAAAVSPVAPAAPPAQPDLPRQGPGGGR